MRILETERLIVRQLCADDLDEMHAICGDAELMRFVGEGRPIERELVQKWIEKSMDNYSKQGFGCSAVIEKSSQNFIGYCGLVYGHGSDEVEIIYVLKKAYWGQGLASEVSRAMIDYSFKRHNLKSIIATIDPQNASSIRIVEKLGMKFRGQRFDEDNLPEFVYQIEKPE